MYYRAKTVVLGLLIFTTTICCLVALEIGLRSLFGFGYPLLYIPDQQIGYLLAPNQHTRRFGNRIEINQYSMRSHPVAAERSLNTLRVLLLGDSVANGGWWTDQSDTISELIANYSKNQSYLVEVLNASANSWGPRNQLAYLQKFGNFHAQAVVLLINTDDLFATTPTSLPVGRDRNYPYRYPPLALVELFNRYINLSTVPELAEVNDKDCDRVGDNLEAIRQIQAITHQKNSYFLLAMTPLLREIGHPGPRDYEQQVRQRLLDFTAQEQIPYLDFLPIFNASEQPAKLYRDHIHLCGQGNQKVSSIISQLLQQAILNSVIGNG